MAGQQQREPKKDADCKRKHTHARRHTNSHALLSSQHLHSHTKLYGQNFRNAQDKADGSAAGRRRERRRTEKEKE